MGWRRWSAGVYPGVHVDHGGSPVVVTVVLGASPQEGGAARAAGYGVLAIPVARVVAPTLPPARSVAVERRIVAWAGPIPLPPECAVVAARRDMPAVEARGKCLAGGPT